MASPERSVQEMTSAESITASVASPESTRSGHRRRHRKLSKKHSKVPGELSSHNENWTPHSAADVSGTSSPRRPKRSNKSRKASGVRAGAASPDMISSPQASAAASLSICSPPPERLSEPATVSAAPEERPYELPESGAIVRPVPGYASPTMSTRDIVAVTDMWTLIKAAEEEKSQAQILWPVVAAAVIVGIVAAYIFSMMISGHRPVRSLNVYNMYASNDTGALEDAGHRDRALAGWNSDDGGPAASHRATRQR